VDKFFLEERLGIFLSYGIKVAFVCRLERIDLVKFATLVAQLDFVHFVMPALAPASQNGQSQRHFSMS